MPAVEPLGPRRKVRHDVGRLPPFTNVISRLGGAPSMLLSKTKARSAIRAASRINGWFRS
jgi:hypothetical protein